MATKVYDISNLPDRPYDNFLERSVVDPFLKNTETGGSSGTPTSTGRGSSSGGSSSGDSTNTEGNGSVETVNVKTANALNDLWITTYIKSDNWVSGSRGFWIDGPSGYAEFMNIKIAGNISATTGTIGGFVIGAVDLTATFGGNTTILSSGTVSFSSGPTGSPTTKIYQSGSIVTSAITITGGVIGGAPVAQVGYVATSTADIVPLALSCSSTEATVASDGTVSSSVVLTWTAISSTTFDHYIIRYKKDGGSYVYYTYLTSDENTINIEGLVPNISYNFGIASVNKYGSISSYSSDITQLTATSTTQPATVAGVTATAGIQYAILEWTHSSSSDLASYNIYRKTTDDSSTSTLIGNCKANYFIDGGLTGSQIYYYWIKTVNTSGLLSASYSTSVSVTPTDVESSDIVSLAGTKVLIDGVVYLSDWRHGGDFTKIDGGEIYTGSITTSQLNFVPVTGADVIASINASVEGITIDADNIEINGSTTFSSGYDPTDKVDELGGSYASASSGARVLVFPDANTGIQVIDDGAADVFKVIVGGTDVGDVIIGDYSSEQGMKYDKSENTTTFQGSILSKAAVIGGSTRQYTSSDGGMNSFGDGDDDPGNPGNTVYISTNTTLTSDVYYKNLIINAGVVLNPNGWRIFCTDTLTVNGTIRRNGNDGGDGTNASYQNHGVGGSLGLGLPSGYLCGSASGTVGGRGTDGLYNSYGNVPAAGSSVSGISILNSIGNTGSSGGTGGAGAYAIGYSIPGGVSTPGTKTDANVRLTANWHLSTFLDITSEGSTIKYKGSSGSAGGGGGGGGNGGGPYFYNGWGGGGGGGGGSGSCGGVIAIYAKNIIISVGGSIETLGGDGGDGGDGGNATDNVPEWSSAGGGGGGGGGAGGNGGELILVYNNLSVLGTVDTSGGIGGTGGTGGLPYASHGLSGSDGADGNDGTDGEKKYYQLSM